MDALRILMADANAVARQGMTFCLRRLAERVEITEATTHDELLMYLETGEIPNLVLLDVDLPGMDGLDGFKAVATALDQIAVVALSDKFDRETGLDAIVAGAAGFIPKTMDSRSLVNALQLVRAGQAGENVLWDAGTTNSHETNSLQELSLRERSTLILMCRGYANREIARRLKLSPQALATRLKALYRKLNARNRREAVAIAIGFGWRDSRNRSTGRTQ